MTAARKLVEPYQPHIEEAASEPSRRPAPKRRRLPATLRICLVAAICVVLGLLYLQQQVTSYYLNMELASLQEQVNSMEQRNDHLMLSLESQRSLKQIEQVARTRLGMVDPEFTATLVLPRQVDSIPEAQGRWLADEQQDSTTGGVLAVLTAMLNKVLPLGGVEAGTLQR
ncbi:MAG TPA: hypothetical protein GX014_04230 [Firmicutes bacterium]|jgi:cell division protein FtsL|nr:hypothetical protein [Bacillota bacterium]